MVPLESTIAITSIASISFTRKRDHLRLSALDQRWLAEYARNRRERERESEKRVKQPNSKTAAV